MSDSHGFVPRFLHFWRRHIAPSVGPKPRVGVAVSAGRDSCALAWMLRKFGKILGIRGLVLLHLDHGLRPAAERARDLRVLQALARRVRAPLYVSRARIPPKAGVEAAARAARLAFYGRAVRRHALDCVATAHHLDDRIETFFLFLLRGSSSRGLSSLRAVEQIHPVALVRPFLPFSREEVGWFAGRESLDFHEDSTNRDRKFLRNHIRHELIPILQSRHPGFQKAMLATLESLEEEDAALQNLADRVLDALTAGVTGRHNGRFRSVSMDRTQLRGYPLGLLVRILQQADRRSGGSGLLGGHTNLNAAAQAIYGNRTSVFALPSGRQLAIQKDRVKLQSG